MADTNTTTNNVKKDEMGIFVRGVYLGCGQRAFGQGPDKRVVSAVSVALPNLGGALEIGVNEEYLGRIDDAYTMGVPVEIKLDTPRAYNGRIYYTALRVGTVDCI